MKLGILVLLLAQFALADHRVSVTVDGHNYSCNSGGGTGTDPNCINALSNACRDFTTLSGTACFEKSSSACRNQGSGYPTCVISTTNSCRDQTTKSGTECFELALASCSGNAESINEMLKSANQRGAR